VCISVVCTYKLGICCGFLQNHVHMYALQCLSGKVDNNVHNETANQIKEIQRLCKNGWQLVGCGAGEREIVANILFQIASGRMTCPSRYTITYFRPFSGTNIL